MLTQIKLKNFKCFKDETTFPVTNVNLLTGINGRGKSTLLQSLLLMRQSIDHNESTTQVLFNGSCVSLSTFDDVRNSGVSRDEEITFDYYFDCDSITSSFKYHLSENLEDGMVANISRISLQIQRRGENKEHEFIFTKNTNGFYDFSETPKSGLVSFPAQFYLSKLIPQQGDNFLNNVFSFSDFFRIDTAPSLDRIHYISADRFGPQDFYFKSTLTRFPNVGVKGELTVNVLYKKRDELVDEKLCLGENAKTLATQVEEWANEIFDGAKVEVPYSASNVLDLFFNTNASKDRFKPANVGFGYSYALPIIVSGLIAKAGEIIVVENPEAHLHPKAQSRLAKFLAKVSSCGVQVFIESHSDHILNALRIALLDKLIFPEELNILYFQQNPSQPIAKISVQSDGAIEEWPEGFFDQLDKDFERLFGI